MSFERDVEELTYGSTISAGHLLLRTGKLSKEGRDNSSELKVVGG